MAVKPSPLLGGITLLLALALLSSSPLPATAPAGTSQPQAVIPWGGSDFVQYYVCARLARAGANPYDLEAAGRMQQHLGRTERALPTYGPPTSLLPFYPLSTVNFPTAVNIHLLFNLALLLLCVLAWARMLFPDQLWLAPLLLLAWPIWLPSLSLLGMGQISLWVLAGATGWQWSRARKRPILAGILLSLVIMKPHLGLSILLFALVGAWRDRAWSGIVAFFLAAAAWAVAAELTMPGVFAQYVKTLLVLPPPSIYAPATLNGWGRMTFGAWFGIVGWLIFVLGLLAVAWLGLRRNLVERMPQAMLTVCALSLCASPHAFSYDFVLLLPAFLDSLGRALLTRRPLAYGLFLGWFLLVIWLACSVSSAWKDVYSWWIPWAGLALILIQNQMGLREDTAAVRPSALPPSR